MAAHTITSFEHATWATTAHRAARHGESYRLRWQDIKQPELPAEQRLGARFRMAMIRLEQLLYAIYGARSQYEKEDPDDKLWYKRQHPRCLWGPEQWRSTDDLTYWEASSGTAWQNYYEYAASGGLAYGTHPEVPVRSRSGDPALQYRMAQHDVRFPVGSVWRSPGYEVSDHRALPVIGGLAAEAVYVYYRPPEGVVASSALLRWRIGVIPGNMNMSWDDTEGHKYWYAFVGARPQGTVLKWQIRATFEVGEETETVYEPLGEDGAVPLWNEPPEDEHDRGPYDCYTCVWCTHYNPYAHGLPEFMHWYPEFRKNVDEYLFNGTEQIQPELINLCRFVLNYISTRFHHNPRLRGHPDACCFYMAVLFRWSGANYAPEYVTGGKRAPPDDPDGAKIRPLTNHPEEIGDLNAAARFSWRGTPMVYKDPQYYVNYYYGMDESWFPYPEYIVVEDGPGGETWYAKGTGRGLLPWDVIDPVHLEEIIAAVNYFVDYGLWTHIPYYSTKLTPGTFLGQQCGYFRSFGWTSWWPPEQNFDNVYHYYQWECCEASYDPPHPWEPGGYCTPWTKPSWAACQGHQERCYHDIEWSRSCYSAGGDAAKGGGLQVNCDSQTNIVCGQAESTVQCHEEGPTAYGRGLWERIFGWSAWVCGPRQNSFPNACDELHGNGLIKGRWNHLWTPDIKDTGPSAGNRFGDLEACGTLADPERPVWFGGVEGVIFNSPGSSWFEMKDCEPESFFCGYSSIDPYVERLPGLGAYKNYEGQAHDDEKLCGWWRELVHGVDWFHQGCSCEARGPVCFNHRLWVAIDLNLDGVGRPYTEAPGEYPPATDRIPKLYDYDFDPPEGYPEPWSECPCETWTGPSPCT